MALHMEPEHKQCESLTTLGECRRYVLWFETGNECSWQILVAKNLDDSLSLSRLPHNSV
jgi:hypothetical protein